MHILPPPPLLPLIWGRRVVVLAALSLLTGCGVYGDFGELHPSLVRDDIHDWVAVNGGILGSGPRSTFDLTDDERQLRDLAYPLIEPPYDRQRWYSVLGEYGVISALSRGTFDREAYAKRLKSSRYRLPSARYAQLTEDVRNDMTRIPQFFENATRVLDTDQKRQASLTYVSDLSPKERNNALRRMRENASLVSLVRTKLEQRVAGYRFALERLVITTPSRQAVEAEQSLTQLQGLVARYGTQSAPTWEREQNLASAR